VEKEAELGGNLRSVYIPYDGKDPQSLLRQLVESVRSNPKITVHLQSTVHACRGFKGNFTSTIQTLDGSRYELSHGVIILATGAKEYRGEEYGYGTDPKIVTQQEFEALLVNQKSSINNLKSIAMIQCVGPAEQFCSRICCTVALKNALAFKQRNPQAQVTVLYKDIRTYGFKERLYTTARQNDVIFVRYDDEHFPQVIRGEDQRLSNLLIWDPSLAKPIELHPDLLVLSMPIVPNQDARELARLFKVSIDADGFFLEAHVKLRPVDFSTDGVFMAGMAHYPKLLDETMIQAQAAASRAARVLSQKNLSAGGRVAVVDPQMCTGCLTCVRICPFNVPQIQANLTGVGNILGAAFIEPAVCQGCGTCAAECPARAIQLMHYTDAQMIAKVNALMKPLVSLRVVEQIRND
jgi:heterodisulfide reductase subunit A-like polyferredoxin